MKKLTLHIVHSSYDGPLHRAVDFFKAHPEIDSSPPPWEPALAFAIVAYYMAHWPAAKITIEEEP